MVAETIATLEKNIITKVERKSTGTSSGCCGGTPGNNADACCKLDEEKRAEGEEDCGCNTTKKKVVKISCC